MESREAVGFQPENPYFYKYLTGEETLRFFGRLCGLRGAALKKRVTELLDLVAYWEGHEQQAYERLRSLYGEGQEERLPDLDYPAEISRKQTQHSAGSAHSGEGQPYR